MGKKIALIFILVLFLLPLVLAVPPQQEFGDLNIEYSKFDAKLLNADHNFTFHVSNNTHIISNAVCYFDMKYQDGELQFYKNNLPSVQENDYYVYVDENNFSKIGDYSVIVECKTDLQAGAVSFPVEVTGTGHLLDTGKGLIYFSMFSILIFLFLITFFGIGLLPSSNTKDEDGKILQISYLKYFRSTLFFFEWVLLLGIIYLASNLGFAYMGEELFANLFFVIFRIMFAVTPFIVILWFWWIIVQMIQDGRLRKLMERGFGGYNV